MSHNNTPKQETSLPPYPAQQPMAGTPQMSAVNPQGQAYPPQAYQQGHPIQQAPYQGQQYAPPIQVHQRNEALIAQYQKEISDNEIGCTEVLWLVCCGVFGLICCMPKYNAQQRAKTNLQVELAKAP
ncbi:hypothetical protein BGX27_009538 [Mortierella sp. AM989]|nr:hypothetical protein BGX27_009538 [Mortierella sp. AM989]